MYRYIQILMKYLKMPVIRNYSGIFRDKTIKDKLMYAPNQQIKIIGGKKFNFASLNHLIKSPKFFKANKCERKNFED